MSHERNMNGWRLLPGILALILAMPDLSRAESGGASDFLDAVGELNAPAPQPHTQTAGGSPLNAGMGARTAGESTTTSHMRAAGGHRGDNADVVALTSELARVRAENTALRKQKQAVVPAVERSDKIALQSKLTALQQQDALLLSKLKSSEAARKRAESDATSLRARMEKQSATEVSTGELAALQKKVKELNATVATATAERERLKSLLSQQGTVGATVSAGGQIRALTLENDTLRARVQTLLSASEQARSSSGLATAAHQQKEDELVKRLTALGNEREQLQKDLAALQHSATEERTKAVQQSEEHTQQVTALTARLATVEKENATLKTEKTTLVKNRDEAGVRQQAEFQDKLKSLTRDLTDVTAERDQLATQVTSAQKETSDALIKLKEVSDRADDSRQQVVTLTARLEKMSQDNDIAAKSGAKIQATVTDLSRNLAAMTAERDKLKEGLAETEKKHRDATTMSVQQTRLSDDDLHHQLAALTDKYNEVMKENTGLKTRLNGLEMPSSSDSAAGAPRSDKQDRTPEPRQTVSLATDVQRQSYVSGVMLAGSVKRVVALQKDLGLTPDPSLLLAGVSDEVNGNVLLDESVLNKSYQTLMTRLSSLEEAKYKASVQMLEKRASGKSLLKRNRNVFFVQERKGAGAYQKGTAARFDLMIATLDGRILMKKPGLTAEPGNPQVPYIVSQTLALSGPGGKVSVYCFASDIWPPDQYPEGVFAYTPVRYQFSFDK